ncbi:hypothetical protein NM688_g2896 [Phlebia brevispora]|uniref:Uncharacterized protein n=1 Tax=Phlebia brevispora TaxID=194682 RepID=A0ACC1T767_9APHY|nr:hypothetical protein NM688_g2896 [Phlebia brevispora]
MNCTQISTPALQGPLKLDNTLGAVFVGNMFVAVLYGVSCVQIYMYHHRSVRDSRIMQAVIYFLWILDTLQLAFWTDAIYYYSVTNYFNPPALQYSPWSFWADYIVGVLSDAIVTSVYTYRLWRLRGRFAVAQLIVQCAYLYGHSFRLYRLIWLMIADFAAKGVGDTCIAIALWITLRRKRTGVRRTDTLIKTLVLYSMSTCTLTSVSVMGTIIVFAIAPLTLIYDAFAVVSPKLVFNSLLAFLNTREAFAATASVDQPLSIHLSRLTHSEPEQGGSKASRNMNPIAIEVSKSTYVDVDDTKDAPHE